MTTFTLEAAIIYLFMVPGLVHWSTVARRIDDDIYAGVVQYSYLYLVGNPTQLGINTYISSTTTALLLTTAGTGRSRLPVPGTCHVKKTVPGTGRYDDL